MSPLPQLSSRSELAALFRGQCVELGVASGAFSREIIQRGQCHLLWSVDRWSDHHDLREYKEAALRLAMAGEGACVPLRMTFDEALPLFEDGSLDGVFFDGYAHTFQNDGKTLYDWWPKLKSGALVAGHDYHPKWQGNMDMVDRFSADVGMQFSVTGEKEGQGFPSWFGFKI